MLVKTYGSALMGINSTIVTVEVNVNNGVNFHLVGLADSAVKESHQRIQAALKNIGYKMPVKEYTINMAPADIRKEGSSYDLTLAIGILAGTGQISNEGICDFVIMGELSLDGDLRPIKGILPIAIEAKKESFKGIIVPSQNALEAAVVEGLTVYGVDNITQVIDFFNKDKELEPKVIDTQEFFYNRVEEYPVDFSDVKGQENIKRAFEIAAAGGHNVILIGPPGAGKTMLAKRLPTILPPLSIDESLETTKIHSVVGKIKKDHGLITARPFRSPHHTIYGSLPICNIQIKAKKPCYKPYPANDDTSLGAALKTRRLDADMTQKDVADYLGILKDSYQNLEWNKYNPSIRRKKDVNRFLGYNYWDDGSGSLANRCLLYRVENRMTVKELAEKINLSPRTLERLEKKLFLQVKIINRLKILLK